MKVIKNHPANNCRLTILKKLELNFWDFIIRHLETSHFLRSVMGKVFHLQGSHWIRYALICAAVGLVAMSAVWIAAVFPVSKAAIFPSFIASKMQTAAAQQNILIIHVSSINSTNPELISIWALFRESANLSNLIFKPLYPRPMFDETSNRILRSFSLTSQGKPSNLFIQSLTFDGVNWDKTILLDQQDILTVTARLSVLGSRLQNSTPANSVFPNPILGEESSLINNWCSQLAIAKSNNIDPSQLIPERLLQGNESQVFRAVVDQINASTTPLRCKIIPLSK